MISAPTEKERTVTGMTEYIKREAAIEAIMSDPPDAHYPSWYIDHIKTLSAADVVEVVRCCNCEFHDHDGTSGYCNYWRRWSNMSDFCSRGK